ncbi:hypothetical protein DH2020_003731 [Rehmannia glutinosa]|uniref:B12D protein n=1 Tax=Rehmannia glutinosa TaxID=99300 RepID=A0ABR0XMH1_REHGL
MSRWVKPEVYPLFASVGVVLGICSMQLVRNICTNPEVRGFERERGCSVLDNFEEGKKYKEHGLRKYLRGRRPEVMPKINGFFSDPN